MVRWLDAALDYIPSWLDYQVQQTQQPGCLLAIVHDGKVVLEHATGLANLDTGEELTPRHRFRIASHTKAFTAAGILKLREQRKLGLDDPVGKYVEGLHPGVAEARLSHLLSHGAGLTRDGEDSGWFAGRKPFPDRAKLMEILAQPPVIEAGLRLKYSNPGFALLGLVIESVTGVSWRRWIEREIVAAAGLEETIADGPRKRGTPFARGHMGFMPSGERACSRVTSRCVRWRRPAGSWRPLPTRRCSTTSSRPRRTAASSRAPAAGRWCTDTGATPRRSKPITAMAS